MEQSSKQKYLVRLEYMLRYTYDILSVVEIDKDFPEYKLWEVKNDMLILQKKIDNLAIYIKKLE